MFACIPVPFRKSNAGEAGADCSAPFRNEIGSWLPVGKHLHEPRGGNNSSCSSGINPLLAGQGEDHETYQTLRSLGRLRPSFGRDLCVGIVLLAAVSLCAPLTAASSGHGPLIPAQVPRGPGKTPIGLNVDKAPIRAVLHVLFRRAGQNYVLGPHVAGTVTASFANIPFDTALKQILSTNSVPLTVRIVNGIYIIKGPASTPAPPTATTRPGRTPVGPARSFPRGSHGRRRSGGGSYTIPGTGGTVQVVP